MRIASFEFAPPWWAVAVYLPLLGLLLWLGSWQLERGQAKANMLAERHAAEQSEPATLPGAYEAADTSRALDGRHVAAAGQYLAERQLLLDNQVWQGKAGYRVWTPMVLPGDRLVMVDRGWVPLSDDRADPPEPDVPAGRLRVNGLWRDWPEPGIRLDGPTCREGAWPRVVQYPRYPAVACHYDAEVLDGLLLLDESADGGFPRDWHSAGVPPSRHYGYAVQWYALALTLTVIFLWMNLSRRR